MEGVIKAVVEFLAYKYNLYNSINSYLMLSSKKKYIFLFLISFLITYPSIVFAQELPLEPAPSVEQTESLDPSFKEKKAKEGYVVNLRDLIKESRKKIDHVNVKIQEQAVRSRNQQRELKAREYYEKAMRLYEEGKLEEAQEFWNKAIKITEHPEMKGYISESVKKTKKQEDMLREEEDRKLKRLEVERGYSAEEVEDAYQQAVSLFQQRKYLAAQEDFEKVDEMFPDHKATRSYLMMIEQELKNEQEKIIADKLKEDAIARRKEKEEWRSELEQKREVRRKQLEEQADVVYQDALKFYKAKQFADAKKKFQEVEWILPEYKSTVKFLESIDEDIRIDAIQRKREEDLAQKRDREIEKTLEQKKEELSRVENLNKEKQFVAKLEEEAEFIYKTAILLYEQKNYKESKEKFLEIQDVYPDYKASAKFLAKIDRILAVEEEKAAAEALEAFQREVKTELQSKKEEESQIEAMAREVKEEERIKLEKDLRDLYESGVFLYKKKLYEAAKEKFLEIEAKEDNYKMTKKYLVMTYEKLGLAEEAKQKENELEELKSTPKVKKVVEEKYLSAEKVIVKTGQRKADDIYKEAVTFYKEKKYVFARDKFIEVQMFYPDYKTKQVTDYLNRLEKNIDRDSAKIARETLANTNLSDDEKTLITRAVEERKAKFEKEAEGKYRAALEFFKAGDYEEARIKFIQVEAIYPDYKDTADYLSKIDSGNVQSVDGKIKESKKRKKAKVIEEKFEADNVKKIKKVKVKKPLFQENEQSQNELANKFQSEADELFNQAVNAFDSGDYLLAKQKFQNVDLLIPEYKTTKRYLKKIDRKLSQQKPLIENDSPKKKQTIVSIPTNPVIAKEVKEVYEPKSVVEVKEMLEDKDQETEWEKRREEKIVELKAREEVLESLNGERYKEFKKNLQEEWRDLDRAERERKRQAKLRKKRIKADLLKEEALKEKEKLVEDEVLKEEQLKLEKEELDKREQELIQQRADELISKRAARKEKRAAARQKRLEEQTKARDEKERLAIIKRQEEDARREAEELTKQREREEKRLAQEKDLKETQEQQESHAQQKQEIAAQEAQEQKSIEIEQTQEALVGAEQPSVKNYEYERLKKEREEQIENKRLEKFKREQNIAKKKQRKELSKHQKAIEQLLDKKGKKENKRWANDVDKIYKEAIALYDDGQYSAARTKFGLIDGVRPGYKATRLYLLKIDERLRSQEDELQKQAKENIAQEERAQLKAEKEAQEEAVRLAKEEPIQEEIIVESTQPVQEAVESVSIETPVDESVKEEKSIDHKKELKLAKQREKEDAKRHKLEEVARKRAEKEAQRVAKFEERQRQEELKKQQREEALNQKKLEQEAIQNQIDQQMAAPESEVEQMAEAVVGQDVVKEQNEMMSETDQKVTADQIEDFRKRQKEQELTQIKQQKQQEQIIKRRQKELEKYQQEEQKRIKKSLEALYKDATVAMKSGQYDKAKNMFDHIESVLLQSGLPQKDFLSMRDRLARDRDRLQNLQMSKEFATPQDSLDAESSALQKLFGKDKQESVQDSSENLLVQQRKLEEEKRLQQLDEEQQKELKRLESQVRIEEERLTREQQKEEERKRKEQAKQDAIAQKEAERQRRLEEKMQERELGDQQRVDRFEEREKEKREMEEQLSHVDEIVAKELGEGPAKEVVNFDQENIEEEKVQEVVAKKEEQVKRDLKKTTSAEEEKRLEIERLVKERQKQLEEEREKVRREFEASLANLYEKAAVFYKDGEYDKAKKVFEEIEEMKPGYKDVESFLTKIEKAKSSNKGQAKKKSKKMSPQVSVESESSIPSTEEIQPAKSKSRAQIVREALDALEQE